MTKSELEGLAGVRVDFEGEVGRRIGAWRPRNEQKRKIRREE